MSAPVHHSLWRNSEAGSRDTGILMSCCFQQEAWGGDNTRLSQWAVTSLKSPEEQQQEAGWHHIFCPWSVLFPTVSSLSPRLLALLKPKLLYHSCWEYHLGNGTANAAQTEAPKRSHTHTPRAMLHTSVLIPWYSLNHFSRGPAKLSNSEPHPNSTPAFI